MDVEPRSVCMILLLLAFTAAAGPLPDDCAVFITDHAGINASIESMILAGAEDALNKAGIREARASVAAAAAHAERQFHLEGDFHDNNCDGDVCEYKFEAVAAAGGNSAVHIQIRRLKAEPASLFLQVIARDLTTAESRLEQTATTLSCSEPDARNITAAKFQACVSDVVASALQIVALAGASRARVSVPRAAPTWAPLALGGGLIAAVGGCIAVGAGVTLGASVVGRMSDFDNLAGTNSEAANWQALNSARVSFGNTGVPLLVGGGVFGIVGGLGITFGIGALAESAEKKP